MDAGERPVINTILIACRDFVFSIGKLVTSYKPQATRKSTIDNS
jgi:hypothetical protein